MRKILVLSYDPDKPSFRYRLAPLLAELETRQWQVQVDTLPTKQYALRIWRRAPTLRNANVVLLHKLRLHPVEMRWVARYNSRTIFDIDDATWLSQPKHNATPMVSPSRERAFRGMCRYSTLTIAGNSILADKARTAGAHVQIIPTAVQVSAYADADFAARNGGNVVWIGLPGNLQYLEPLHGVFAELARTFPTFRLRIVSSHFPDWRDVPIERVTWRPGIETESLLSADIGLMPLQDDEFTRGKCAFKLLQYMAASLPCVASPVGVNCDVISNGHTGYLATSPQEWLASLTQLLADQTLRENMGRAGRARVQQHYDLQTIIPRAANLVESLVEPNTY